MTLLVLAGMLSLATSLGNVPPDQDRVPDESAPSLAWLAFNAAESGDRSQVPVLMRALTLLQNDSQAQRRLAQLAVVDALVRLDAKPSLDLLAGIFDSQPVQAVLMLKRFGPERDWTVFRLLQRSQGDRWFSLASLLQETRARKFAAHLLADLKIRLLVSVSEDGNAWNVEGGVLGGVTCGCGVQDLAPGFPPLPTYRFTSSNERGAALLTDRVRPTYYVRQQSQAGYTPVPSPCDLSGPTTRDRLAHIAALLRGVSIPLYETELELVAWAGAAELRSRVAAATRRVEAAYTSLVDVLEEDGSLTTTEAASLRPDVRIELHDLRRDHSESLPDFR